MPVNDVAFFTDGKVVMAVVILSFESVADTYFQTSPVVVMCTVRFASPSITVSVCRGSELASRFT